MCDPAVSDRPISESHLDADGIIMTTLCDRIVPLTTRRIIITLAQRPGAGIMVASRDTKPNKTSFITAHLEKNPTANRKSVIEAWTKAGHKGTVSTTLVSKMRRDLGLAGNLRGRPRLAELNGSNGAPKIKSERATAKKLTRDQANAKPGSAVATKPTTGQHSRMIDEVEAGIDHLMFTLKVNGGMPEVEAALRAARRLLTGGQGA